MNKNDRPLILLTNDDGIRSPGLWAAAEALSSLGYVVVAAPRDQSSGAGRSMPRNSDGSIRQEEVKVGGKCWPVYAVGGSPAQSVQHGVLEIAERKPDLVVAGINYGENVGTGITASGTVGAALEAAANDIPALAVSLQTDQSQHMTNDPAVDFCTAIYFTRLFAQRWLAAERLPDVDVLKIDIPASATPDTPWVITRLQKGKYYTHLPPLRKRLDDEGRIGYMADPRIALDLDSDAKGILDGLVTVTPLSLDITSRIAPDALHRVLNNHRD